MAERLQPCVTRTRCLCIAVRGQITAGSFLSLPSAGRGAAVGILPLPCSARRDWGCQQQPCAQPSAPASHGTRVSQPPSEPKLPFSMSGHSPPRSGTGFVCPRENSYWHQLLQQRKESSGCTCGSQQHPSARETNKTRQVMTTRPQTRSWF